ncbi:hypothetical protein SAMN02745704_01918 [Paucidesulfovibrio gracilis DSM 16080]|uniref:Uncharacterized protein n=1 Tax=Paucidesulfovibrio gracilis DSM 16080 TaxID=1121449 RepID=A0A1T4X844_9BACT|nr:hypothetical protein SAMN02745704_01918 [Paucidesulfovibrio gracilis DSM 16080]
MLDSFLRITLNGSVFISEVIAEVFKLLFTFRIIVQDCGFGFFYLFRIKVVRNFLKKIEVWFENIRSLSNRMLGAFSIEDREFYLVPSLA